MRNLHGTEHLTKNKNFDPLRENRAFRRKAKRDVNCKNALAPLLFLGFERRKGENRVKKEHLF